MNSCAIFHRSISILMAIVLIMAPISSALAAGQALDDGNQVKGNNSSNDSASKSNYNPKYVNSVEYFETGIENNSSSHKELSRHLKSLQPVSTSPFELKQQAFGMISSITIAENTNNKDVVKKLDTAEIHIERSINTDLWFDRYHLKPVKDEDEAGSKFVNTTVFEDERTAVKNVLEILSKNKEDTIDDDLLIEIVINLVRADRNIAQTAIADAQLASTLPLDFSITDKSEVEKNLRKAQNEFDRANEQVAKGEPIDAIRHYEKAWEYATTELLKLDAATTPVIVFDSIDSMYINRTATGLSGHVEDAAVYTIPSITLSVNGITTVLELNDGKFTTTLTLQEGINYINANVADAFGSEGMNNVILVVDTVLPEISVDGVADGYYYNSSISFTADMTDEHPDTLTIRVNGNPYQSGTPIIAEGTYTVDITARDLAGNTAYQSLTFHIDMTAPRVLINEPSNNSFISGTAKINSTIVDVSPVTVSMFMDGAALPDGTTSLDTTSLADGMHTITVLAIDAAKNRAEESNIIIVDNTPPSVSILEPLDNEAIRQIREILADVYDQYLDGVTLFINDEAVSNSDRHTFNTSAYPDGTYTITAEAVDLAKNTGSDNITVIVDNTQPVIKVTAPQNSSFARGTVSIDAEILETNTASIQVAVDGILISDTIPASWDTSSYPDGSHTIAIYVTDTAGNDASAFINVLVDNTPPSVSILSPSNGSSVREAVSITSDVFDINLENITVTINGTVVSGTGSFTWNTTEYADGWYKITVMAIDIVGNYGENEILVEVDNTPPLLIVNELIENPTLDQPEYSLFILTDSDATVLVNDEIISLINGTTVYSQNIHEGINTFEITALDATGNKANWNIIRLIDSDSLPDFFELKILGTDPLNMDSDCSKTLHNESNNGIPDDREDYDGDLLPTYIEMKLGTDPFSDDTDEDGLVDFVEAYLSGTIPTIADSDGNGINDGNEDSDEDGISNIVEQDFGTDLTDQDTDNDNLFDGEEIAVGTDPLSSDSDNDMLPDGMEVNSGSNPLSADSDQDNIPDSEEIITQEIFRGPISINITGKAMIFNTLKVSDVSSLSVFSEIPGQVGEVFEFSTPTWFESATITIPYNESSLGDIPENDLRGFTIDENTHNITLLPTVIDTENNNVKITTDHFSFIGLLVSTSWSFAWISGNKPTVPEYAIGDKLNIKATVHNIGDAPVDDDVLVTFYEGDPDVNGRDIGTAIISGGIGQGDAKSAILYGYTISSSSIDIYVVVDPNNNIYEKNLSNNKANRVLSIGPQLLDSDGDGLSDYDESNGMMTSLGNTIKTDPNNPDSDNDLLSDGLEMGIRTEDYYVYFSDPTKPDSDGDELYDNEERAFETKPLFDKDSDDDGLWDGEEVHICYTNPASPDSNWNNFWDGNEYFYSYGYQDHNQYLFLNTGTSLPQYEVEAPVTVEDIDFSMQSSLELAYDLGFEGVKFFCLGDFAEGKLTASGAFDTFFCAGDVAALIIPAEGPVGETAITSVKTMRFVNGVKKWFNFGKVPNALHKLQKARNVKLGFKYVLRGQTKHETVELTKSGIQQASELGIIWQKGKKGETLNAYGNLLRHYADDSYGMYDKIYELKNLKNVDLKNMERVYENGGDLKKTINVIEKTEDEGSVIRWLENGKLAKPSNSDNWIEDVGGYGWEHIRNNHVKKPTGNQFLRYGNKYADEREIQNLIMESTMKGKKIVSDGDIWYIYEVPNSEGKILSTLVGDNGYIVTSIPTNMI